MKLDFHGIRFNIWFLFLLFATGIVVLLGVLQFSLIRPYYRNTKIRSVQEVSSQIQQYVIEDNQEDEISRAFQIAVDNNLCAVVFNDNGRIVYDADSLGSGCVFHARMDSLSMKEDVNLQDGNSMKKLLRDHGGEYSINLTNDRTEQEMIVYGRQIRSNLGSYYLFVNSPLEPVDSIVSFFSSQYILYTILVMIAATLISIWISGRISKPIVNMRKQADRLAEADYGAHFEGGSFTETKDLASELNDATDKLSRIDSLRKDLIANVSHDIKTPLTSIRAYAEMVRDVSGNDEAKRTKHMNVIIQEADYLGKLVTDMQELSEMQSGSYVLKLKNFDISEKIREAVLMDDVLLQEGKLNVHVEVPDTLTVYGDEVKISQVIANFLSNAIKHTKPDGSIWLRAYRLKDEETVRVEVQDEGEGIAEKDLPFIWDRYQKTSRSFSRSMSSTGLGLAIVKAILDAHHARYGVSSKAGQGSLFWFELKQPEEPEDINPHA